MRQLRRKQLETPGLPAEGLSGADNAEEPFFSILFQATHFT